MLNVTISGMFYRHTATGAVPEDYDNIKIAMPNMDEEVMRMHLRGRIAPIVVGRVNKARIDNLHEMIIEDIQEDDKYPEFYGKPVKDMDFEQLQLAASMCDLREFPIKRSSSMTKVREKFVELYKKHIDDKVNNDMLFKPYGDIKSPKKSEAEAEPKHEAKSKISKK